MERQVYTGTVNKALTDDFGTMLPDIFISTESFQIDLTVEKSASVAYDISGASAVLYVKANDTTQTKITLDGTGVFPGAGTDGNVTFDIAKDLLDSVLATFPQSNRLPTILLFCDISTGAELIQIRKLISVVDADASGSGSATPAISSFSEYRVDSTGDAINKPTATADKKAMVDGESGTATRYGEHAYTSGLIATQGDSDIAWLYARGITTNATITEMFLDGVIGGSERLSIAIDTAMAFTVYAVGREDATEDMTSLQVDGLIKRNSAGAVSTVGSFITTLWANDSSASTWSITVTSDNTNKSLKLQATGQAAKTINWNFTIFIREVI